MGKKKESCGPNEIERVGYSRKAYKRKEYVKSNGTVVPATHVSSSWVPPTCIKDKGKPGKGKKILPTPNDKMHLTFYGYSIYAPKKKRHTALIAAAKDNNILEVIRRVNLIRNLNADTNAKKIFKEDLDYMKGMYSNIRKSKDRSEEKKTSDYIDGKRDYKKYLQKGGNDNISSQSSSSIEKEETICNDNNICNTVNYFYETHTTNGKKIMYFSITDKDIDDIYELEKNNFDPDVTKKDITQKISETYGFSIGIRADDILQGYCIFKPIDDITAKIICFRAIKGYNTPLYVFLARYLGSHEFGKIIFIIKLNDDDAVDHINFWFRMGFTAYEIIDSKNGLYMNIEKYLE